MLFQYTHLPGVLDGAVGSGSVLKARMSRGLIGIFHRNNPSVRTMALGVISASNINEYHEYILGVKAARA